MKTIKLKFHQDSKYTSDEVIYHAGKVYDVPVENGYAERWIKRGAEVVKEVVLEEEQKPTTNAKPNKPSKPNKPNKPQVQDEEISDLSVGDL